MPPVAYQLQTDLKALVDRLADLIREIPIKQERKDYSGVVLLGPDYYWGERSPRQIYDQLAIKRAYEEWFEIFCTVFPKPTDELRAKIKDANEQLRVWIELGINWSLEPDPKINEAKLRKDADELVTILAVAATAGAVPPILIPDTNVLAENPEPLDYRNTAGDDDFVFLLLPTVLAELDKLKNNHRNPDFRQKVIKAIARIKGWRRQGGLRQGVTVDRTITVRAIANEPDMKNTLTWLDRINRDDRIVASVLEVQAANPTATVILVTADVNLMNKADVARIETAEL